MYTVTYLNKHTGNHEVAGYEQTIKRAKRLANVFANEPRLVSDKTQVIIWNGQAGGERI